MTPVAIIIQYQNAIWDNKDFRAIDSFFAENVLIHSPVETTQGSEKMKAVIKKWHDAFPNLKVIWDDLICDGDKVASFWHAEGLHEGNFQGKIATRKIIRYSGVTKYQLTDNKISEYWAYVDMQSIMSQIG